MLNLTGKTAKERATIKGQAIAQINALPRTKRKDFDIEIIGINAIPNGVEVFAKAWDSNGQIGFSKDGTVDIERFVFINPPILVDDPAGTIIKDIKNQDGIIIGQRKLKEDIKEALLQSLEHTIKVSALSNPRGKIVSGKVGNTTSTFYPDADTETSSFDGYVLRGGIDETFATIRNGAGTGTNDSTDLITTQLRPSSTTDQYDNCIIGLMVFNTASIPDTDTVSAATLSMYGLSKASYLDADEVTIASATTASNTGASTSDYANSMGGTEYASARIAYASWDTAGYNDFSLNASGISAISLTGVSKFSFHLGWLFDNSFGGTWRTNISNQATSVNSNAAEHTGTTQDPKLVVVHSAVTSVVRNLMTLGVGR